MFVLSASTAPKLQAHMLHAPAADPSVLRLEQACQQLQLRIWAEAHMLHAPAADPSAPQEPFMEFAIIFSIARVQVVADAHFDLAGGTRYKLLPGLCGRSPVNLRPTWAEPPG